MKKVLLSLLFALVAIVIHAFEQGDFTYLVNSDGTATLNGFKSGATFSSTTLTIPGYAWDATAQKRYQVKSIAWGAFNPNIRTEFATKLRAITRVTINYGVKELDANIFSGCTSLRLVDLPSSIRKMGAYVFGDCPITNVNFAAEIMPTLVDNLTFSSMGTVSGTRYFTCATPDGMTAANAVSHITGNFTVQWSHTAADFTGWTMGKNTDGNLFDVYYNVVEPGNPAASNVYGKVKLLGANKRTSTTNFTLAFKSDQSINQDAIYYYVTEIDKSMRYRCSDVQVLDMSQTSKVEQIGDEAFYGSTALTKVITKAKNIGNNAFYNCKNLTTVTLNEGVQKLGTQCFARTGVSTVTIPASLTTYGDAAFGWCSNLTKFTVAASSTSFATDVGAQNCLFNYGKTTLYQMGAGSNASSGKLGDYLPYTLTTISNYAMAGATHYVVDIPYGVKTLGSNVFQDMPYVQIIRIPSSVTSFEYTTFSGLSTTTFKHLYINQNEVHPKLQHGAFSSFPSGMTLHVPLWRTNHYKSGSWWINSLGWKTKFTAGVVEDAYDFAHNYSKTVSGTAYVDYTLRYTVNSTGNYTDTKVQSTAANGQLTIVGSEIGSQYFNGTLTLPSTESYRGKIYITTEIQREVFRGKTAIQRVTGGNGIKKIGPLAFYGTTGCTGGFNIPNPEEFGDSALYNCKTPTIALGDRLKRIGQEAFRGSAVKQVIMPNTVNEIGSRFLADARQLDSLKISSGITKIPHQGLAGVSARYLVLPYGVKEIGSYAFVSDEFRIGNGSLISEPTRANVVVIPGSVTKIDPDAFSCARHLDDIYLNCTYGVFTSTKDNWRRRMDLYASNAYDWSGHKLYVPVGHVEQYRNDPGIKAAWKSSDIGPGAFDFTNENNFEGTNYRMSVINPTAKTAKYVYGQGNTGNAIIITKTGRDHNTGIQYTMTEIGDSAFVKHTATTRVIFDDNCVLTRIGKAAFRGLNYISNEISVPESVLSIGMYAFYGCSKLPSVFINRESNTLIGMYAWNSMPSTATDKIKLYVPLNQMHDIANQTKSWLPNTTGNRYLLPYVKPTTEWSAISVPISASGSILLPDQGVYYTAYGYDNSNKKLKLSQLNNNHGVKGGEGMLLKGTVGNIYRFRDESDFYVQTLDNNLLKGIENVTGVTVNSLNTGPWYFKYDNEKFTKITSSTTIPAGSAYLVLQASDGGAASVTTVNINNTVTNYDLLINGWRVTSENCNNLSVINGVTGTVKFDPSTNTLTLQNAKIYDNTSDIISSSIDGLKINVIGTNDIGATQNPDQPYGGKNALTINGNTTITGTGEVTFGSYTTLGRGCAFMSSGKTLTIEGGVDVVCKGSYGLSAHGSNNCKLVMNGENTKLTASGSSQSFHAVKTTLNDGLAITQPVGARFDSAGNVVWSNGNVVSGEDVVISKPSDGLRGDVDGNSKVDVADINIVINITLGKANAADYPGNADLTDNGMVDVADINTIINIMLGKN